MKFIGWAKRSGSQGWTFGIYRSREHKEPCRLDDRGFLQEVFRQGLELLLSDKPKGTVAGRDFAITLNQKGARRLLIKHEWMNVEMIRKDLDSATLIVTLPFIDNSDNGSEFNMGNLPVDEVIG